MILHVGLHLRLEQTISPTVKTVKQQSSLSPIFLTEGEIHTRSPGTEPPSQKPKFPHKPPANRPPNPRVQRKKKIRLPPGAPLMPATDLPALGP